ncbi:MAG: cupin domain-containing protein [Ignavibacteriales bacterium]|nr:cupin domain-containing protein [Ignavibacteriales bacterium]
MSEQERPKLSERKLKDTLLSFSIDTETDKLKSENAWLNGDRNAVTLQKNSNLRVVLISLRKGATLHEHKVEGPITLFVLSGKINFIVGEEKVIAESNGFIVLEKAIPHDVEALEDTTFILTIIQKKYN